MANASIHVEINAKDSKKEQQFYQELFGWHIDTNNPMDYGMIDTHAGAGIGGGIGQARDGRSFVTFYVDTDDPQKILDRAERLGGKTIMKPTQVRPDLTLAMLADPEGNVIGLSKGM